MGINLGALLSPALTVGTNAAADYTNAENDAAKQRIQNAVSALTAQRQAKQDDFTQALQAAQARDANARAFATLHPVQKPTVVPQGGTALGPDGKPMFSSAPKTTPFPTITAKEGIFEKRPDGIYDPVTGRRYTGRLTPVQEQPSFTFTTGTDENGNPVVVAGNTKTGQVTRTDVGKPSTTGGGSGGSGAQAPLDDMIQRYKEIQTAAKDLGAGKWQMTPAMQTREGLTYGVARANAEGKSVPLTQLGASFLMDKTGFGKGPDNPDFARYQALMNSTRALGDDAAKVFKGRQNEEGVLREIALSELTPDDYNNPIVVGQKLQRLEHVIKLAALTNPKQTAASPYQDFLHGIGVDTNAPAAATEGTGSAAAVHQDNPFGDLVPKRKGGT